jgi:pimeloyl-ACP methyl ester carboxylesterase
MLKFLILVFALFFSNSLLAEEVNFKTQDNATIYANYQQRGEHAVLLAHGTVFDKGSWGAFEQRLLKENYTVLAIDFRGYNKSTLGDPPRALHKDILAGAYFLMHQDGIKKVTVLGASMGASAAVKADVYSQLGNINQLILLAPPQVYKPEKIKAPVLFIASQQEPLAKRVEAAYKRVGAPKKIEFIEGKAHAQHVFKTPQAGALTEIILDFLKTGVQSK